jgi:hypothetical protein
MVHNSVTNHLNHPDIIHSLRAITVGRDYPHPEGLEYVRRKWKDALRNPDNCRLLEGSTAEIVSENERSLRKAVGRGRYVRMSFAK